MTRTENLAKDMFAAPKISISDFKSGQTQKHVMLHVLDIMIT